MTSAPTGKQCTAYFRGRGIFMYRGRRCYLQLGHEGKHEAMAYSLDPKAKHIWGRAR